MWELYGQNLNSGFEFTVKTSNSLSKLHRLRASLDNQPNVIYFICSI